MVMDISTICRTCMSTDDLKPIFSKSFSHKRHSKAIFVITGVEVKIDDGLPQNMCISCIHCLNNALKFRRRSRETNKILQNYKTQTRNVDEKVKHINSSSNSSTKLNPTEPMLINDHYTNSCKSEKNQIKPENVQLKTENESDANVKDETFLSYNSIEETYDEDDDKPLKYLLLNDTDNGSDNTENVFIEIKSELRGEERHGVKIPRLSEINEEFVKIENELIEPSNTELPFEIDLSSNPDKRRVTCKLCRKSLSARSVDTHMESKHPGQDFRKVKCDLCDRYIMKNKVNRHRMLMHGVSCGDKKSFRCGYCKTEFEDSDLLIAHMTSCTAKKKKRKIYSGSSRELVQCDVCHKTMQKASVRMHKEIKHAGLGPVCEHCGRRFGNKFRLSEHCRAKHGYDKFKCVYCEFQSASVVAMRNHERRHRGEKPFVCESCGAKFHAAYLLAQHKQSHRTEKTIKCHLCPATFKANNSLHMHKITCHSQCLYKCHMCDRIYSCRHYVVKHLRHFHEYHGPVPKLEKIDKECTNLVDSFSQDKRDCREGKNVKVGLANTNSTDLTGVDVNITVEESWNVQSHKKKTNSLN